VGRIGAVRVGQYKAVFHTGGVEGCGQDPAPFQFHSQPLVFDVSLDPEEQFPLSGPLKGGNFPLIFQILLINAA
jgi:hypothetical protein